MHQVFIVIQITYQIALTVQYPYPSMVSQSSSPSLLELALHSDTSLLFLFIHCHFTCSELTWHF
jgi:hypothetical protein